MRRPVEHPKGRDDSRLSTDSCSRGLALLLQTGRPSQRCSLPSRAGANGMSMRSIALSTQKTSSGRTTPHNLGVTMVTAMR